MNWRVICSSQWTRRARKRPKSYVDLRTFLVTMSSKALARSTSEEEGSSDDEHSSTARDEDEEVLDGMPLEMYRGKVRSTIKLRPRKKVVVESDDDNDDMEPC